MRRFCLAVSVAVLGVLVLASPAASAVLSGPPDAPPPQATPVVIRVADRPIPVKGSDNRYHVVYELELTNFTGASAAIEQVEVLDANGGRVVAMLGADEIAGRLQVPDPETEHGTLGPAQTGLLYLHLTFPRPRAIPQRIEHRVRIALGSQTFTELGARKRVARPTDLVLAPPLRGERFIAGDGCCDSTRHVRATLPVNGRLFTAQRFAIDWEQLDAEGRIYAGDASDPGSYTIYGQPAYAVADARVVAAVDSLPNTPPGGFPEGISLAEADGNHVVLDLGDGRYALYAHLVPGSIRVERGQRVRRGQVLGLVGTSGNSSEPHLHFHVMDGPSPLASNGVPYLLTSFRSTERGVSTAAFDEAIVSGEPIAVEPVAGPPLPRRVMPLDLWIVDFAR